MGIKVLLEKKIKLNFYSVMAMAICHLSLYKYVFKNPSQDFFEKLNQMYVKKIFGACYIIDATRSSAVQIF